MAELIKRGPDTVWQNGMSHAKSLIDKILNFKVFCIFTSERMLGHAFTWSKI